MYQVSYAMEAISQAGSAVGILSSQGVILAAEKRFDSKLLDVLTKTEKMYKIDEHVAVAVAGITSDANILLNYSRMEAHRYAFKYQEPIPIDTLLQRLCDLKQSYTQFGGLRPFGVSFLFAGWDEHFGFQLFQSDPSGNYSGWQARAIGSNSKAAESLLKDEYKEDLDLEAAKMLALKVLSKTMDTTAPTVDKIEFSSVTLDADGNVVYHVLTKEELAKLLKDAEPMLKLQQEEAGDI